MLIRMETRKGYIQDTGWWLGRVMMEKDHRQRRHHHHQQRLLLASELVAGKERGNKKGKEQGKILYIFFYLATVHPTENKQPP